MIADGQSKLTHCISLGSRTRDPSHRRFGDTVWFDVRIEVYARHDGKWTVVFMLMTLLPNGRFLWQQSREMAVCDTETEAVSACADWLRKVLDARAMAAKMLAEEAAS